MIRIVFNTGPIIAQLGKAQTLLADPKPMHEEIGEYVVEATKKRFVTSTAPDGSKWRNKQPATLARYIAQGDGKKDKPLIGPSGRLGREIATLATREQVEIGSALEYSGVMQGGAGRGAFGNYKGQPLPWGDIPARVWLGLSDVDDRNILDIADEAMATALKG